MWIVTAVCAVLLSGCEPPPPGRFATRESVLELIPAARDAVQSSVETHFGTPDHHVAWERMPVKYGGTQASVSAVEGNRLTVAWDGTEAPVASEVVRGAPVVWLGSASRSAKTDLIESYDDAAKALAIPAGEPVPAVGDTLAVGYGSTLQLGRVVYAKNCLHCHGTSGDGAGPTAKFLNPRPRDFRLGVYKFTSTQTPARASRADLRLTIHEGIPGTYMPSFLLTKPEEVDAVIEYILFLSMRGELEKRISDVLQADYSRKSVEQTFQSKQEDYEAAKKAGEDADPPKTLDELILKATKDFEMFLEEDWQGEFEDAADFIADGWTEANDEEAIVTPSAPRVTDDAASRERGRLLYLSDATKCYTCHGPLGRGDGAATADYWPRLGSDEKYDVPGLHDVWGNPQAPRDLTRGIYRGGRRPIDLYRRIYAGIKGTQMPGFGTSLKDDQIWDVVNYVLSLPYQSPSPAATPPANPPASSAAVEPGKGGRS